ncbi:MAG: hypothetical protein M1812_002709 [Candelaria pacifica]|nr:MAG: hypothetical protein M1812_002709 [Candelaria pacifica]
MQYIQISSISLFLSLITLSTLVNFVYGQDGPDLASSQVDKISLPYDFPDQSQPGDKLFPMRECHGVKIEEATIDQLQHSMSIGQLTAQQLASCYVDRITQVDGYVNAVLQLNPDYLQIASQLDSLRKAGTVLSPLHGIPFLVKDNIASKDRMETTAGSYALQGSVVPSDAHVVYRLRAAGALLLGKATLSEWADMRSNNYSEGFSGRGGQARSAYNLTVNPGGSSSGSAIAVAVNEVAFALGTETDGSVINPAERNAIVGIKPTVGLTSRAGVIPESEHQDTVGTFGRTVRDATYVLDAIYGVDHLDNYTLAQTGHTPQDGYVASLSTKDALKGATFGLPWQSFWTQADPAQQAQLVELLDLITSAGATIINGTEIPDYETIVSPNGWNWDYGSTRGRPNESEYTVIKVDFYNNINTYLSTLTNTNIKSLQDIVQYNIDNTGSEGGLPNTNPAFASGQDGLLASLETKGIRNETYWQALAFIQRSTRENGIDAALLHDGKLLDGLLVPPDVGPSYQIAAQAGKKLSFPLPKIKPISNRPLYLNNTQPNLIIINYHNILIHQNKHKGYPMITIPAGINKVSNMPYGLAIMNTAWSESTLVKWASAIEDLQLTEVTSSSSSEDMEYRRTAPKWNGYRERNIPVLNA